MREPMNTLEKTGEEWNFMQQVFPVNTQTFQFGHEPNRNVYYPQVVHMHNHRLQHFINQTIIQQTQALIQEQVANMPSAVVEMLGSYELKNNQRNVLSLSLSNYTYHYQAAHGLTIIKSLTFDLEKGKLDQLKDLFKPGSDYVRRLSELIALQIKERGIPILGEFEGIRPDQDFYIADKALVVYFQLYEITPYAYGFPMFPISVYDIEDIVEENSSLGRMLVNN